MRHPDQATLALHAGGDLGRLARWWTARHLAKCVACRDEVAAFDEMRQVLPDLAEMPEIQWNHMAAEIKANIRLGLAAGECVRLAEAPLRESALFTGGRAAVALCSIVLLVLTGVILEHPAPLVAKAGPMVGSTDFGIQARIGGNGLSLMNTAGPDVRVRYSTNAQGAMEASYVDPETGAVTINAVYVQ